MDVVKEYVNNVNFHWLAVVMSGLYIHLRQICFIGLCLEESEVVENLDTIAASTIFVLSALLLLAEYNIWPRSLKEPPIHLLYIYEVRIHLFYIYEGRNFHRIIITDIFC